MEEIISLLEPYLGAAPPVALGAAFLGGVVASLAPCVYPMIPIVSTYVGTRTLTENTRFKAFSLSLSYVVGMAAVYALLGILAGVTGSFFGSISTSPWSLLLVANIIILFALNILEVISLPAWPAFRVSQNNRSGILGALVLGAASGLIAAPCTSPVLAILLTYVVTTGNALFGGLMMFLFSLGMGTLLVVVGTFSGAAAALPKPGPWMVRAKRILGLLMLALGEYFLIKAGQQWF